MKKTYDTYKERVDFKVITGDGEIERVEIVNDIRDVRYDFKTVFLIFEKGSITIKKPCVYILN